MLFKKTLTMIFSVTLLSLNSFASTKSSHKFVDKEVAGICIGGYSEENVLKLYGKGISIQEGYACCYYNNKEKSFLLVEYGPDKLIESVIIVKEDYEKHYEVCRRKGIETTFQSGKGVKLGDSPEMVLKLYGEPQKKEIKDRVLIFEYHTDYEHDPQVTLAYDAYLYFKDDKLVKLVIHDGE